MTKIQEITNLLKDGSTIEDIKQAGYKQGSIYKAKKALDSIESEPEPEPTQDDPEPIVDEVEVEDPLPDPGPQSEPDRIDRVDEGIGQPDGDPLTLEVGDVNKPFPGSQEFSDIDIVRSDVSFASTVTNTVKDKLSTATVADIGIAELITQVFETVEAITGREHWAVDAKEKKVLKHLCKIPALEKALRSFGIYGCIISLITMIVKRVKMDVKMKRENIPSNNEIVNEIVKPTVKDDEYKVKSIFGGSE